MKKKCSYASKYKATRKPVCGCEACWKKWRESQNSKRYYIEIIYDTGDSFHRETDQVEMVEEIYWDYVEKAKEAIKCIEAHHTFFENIKGYGRFEFDDEEIENMKEEAKKEPWYDDTEGMPESYLFVPNDEGELVRVNAFWRGYFDTLRSAEVKTRNPIDDGMKFTPNP